MRYIPHSDKTLKEMLSTIGVSDFEELISCIPSELRIKKGFDSKGMSEAEILEKYTALAADNTSVSEVDSYLGGGAYEHFIPSVVNHLGSLPQFVTSYTPYQPETNQGTLQALFEYQTLMCLLTGMDVSNSSHYDGATSLAEAVAIAWRRKPGKIVFSRYLNPYYKEVLKTYFPGHEEMFQEVEPVKGILNPEVLKTENLSAVVVQSPNFLGYLEDIKRASDFAHANDALLIASVNPVSLGILEAPGKLGADMVVGEGQPLGNALSFGGPYFGFMCVKKEFMRKMPGRIVGRTLDNKGREGYVLTLQAREQHIRREKATSNICSNQALCALRAAIYLSYLGEQGFKNLSRENYEKAHFLKKRLSMIQGLRILNNETPFFNEFAIKVEKGALKEVMKELRKCNILPGVDLSRYYPELSNTLLIAVTETKTVEDLSRFAAEFSEVIGKS